MRWRRTSSIGFLTAIKMKTRKCSICKLYLPISEFYPVRQRGRIGLQGHCKKCSRATSRQFQCANRERINEQAKMRRRADPGHEKQIQKRAYDKKISSLPPLLLLAWRKGQTERMATWRKANTIKYGEWQRKRKLHLTAKESDVTAVALREMLRYYDYRCGYCGRRVDPSASDKRDRPTFDHMRAHLHEAANIC